MNPDYNKDENTIEYGPTSVVGGDMNSPADNPNKPVKKTSKFNLSKKTLAIAAAAVLLIGGGVTAFLLLGGDEQAPVANQQTQVKLGVVTTLIDGSATYKTGGGEWQELTANTALAEGDWVSTGTASRIVLTFDDGSAFRLDESTTVGLISLDPQDVKLDQALGTAYSRVVASDRKFTVSVDGTSFAALGTAFTTINLDTEKGVQVLQSSVKADGVDEAVSEGKQYFKKHSDPTLVDKTTDISLDQVKSDAFMLWNLEQDEQDIKFRDKLGFLGKVKESIPDEDEQPASTNAIQLSARNNDKGTVLSWSVSGIDFNDGFKVVRSSKSDTPTFGRDDSKLVKSSSRSLTWKGDQHKKEYWYRVCAYRPDQKTCTSYSNAVKIASVFVQPVKVTRGKMNLTENSGLLTWNYTGKAVYGYKVVVASNAKPTYPEDGYVYYGKETSYALNLADKPDGTYYVRVCAYTNGSEAEKCVDYSDDLIITKP